MQDNYPINKGVDAVFNKLSSTTLFSGGLKYKPITKEVWSEGFTKIDTNNNGSISFSEFTTFFGDASKPFFDVLSSGNRATILKKDVWINTLFDNLSTDKDGVKVLDADVLKAKFKDMGYKGGKRSRKMRGGRRRKSRKNIRKSRKH